MVIVHGHPLTVEEEGFLNALILNEHMEVHNECVECKRHKRKSTCSECLNNGHEERLWKIIQKFNLEEWV